MIIQVCNFKEKYQKNKKKLGQRRPITSHSSKRILKQKILEKKKQKHQKIRRKKKMKLKE